MLAPKVSITGGGSAPVEIQFPKARHREEEGTGVGEHEELGDPPDPTDENCSPHLRPEDGPEGRHDAHHKRSQKKLPSVHESFLKQKKTYCGRGLTPDLLVL